MKNEMRLQGIGLVEGTEAGKLQVGDITRWNFGGLERITSIEFSKTGKTIIVGIEYINSTGEMVQSERKMRVTRLVNIVASGNTKLTGNASFEMVEEAEVEETTVVTWYDYAKKEEFTEAITQKQLAWLKDQLHIEVEDGFFEMKPSIHEVAYRVTNYGTYVEVMLFVTDVANDITLVTQQEGIFDNMAEAETLINILEKSKNKIEYVETIAYTG